MGENKSLSDDNLAQTTFSASSLLLMIGDTTWRMLVPSVGFTLLGVWLDSLWGTKPWLMFAGIAVGAFFAVFLVRLQLRRAHNA